jgi:hypothetical protein
LFSHILGAKDEVEVREIEGNQYRLGSVGHTFDGRDLFAPSAAWLTKGAVPSSFGRVIHDPIALPIVEPRRQGDRLVGRIEHVDRFGNLISNLTLQHIQEFQACAGRQEVLLHIAGHTIEGLVTSYSEGLSDGLAGLINSDGRVEIFVNGKSAAQHLRAGVGGEIYLR